MNHIDETYPNKKMGCGMAEFELLDRLESLIINEEEFIKSSVPEIVEIYDDPTKRGINNCLKSVQGIAKAFKGTDFLNVIPILSLISKSLGLTPSAKIQSKQCNNDPSAIGSSRDVSGTVEHIRRPDLKGINSKW
ncbi:hypothetical protein J1N35_024223 [Gossypium stocksii]|uniref:Uncharacterized protein n=1 Tax=Gossypium stocksii TaxID=47602 RepID=A0A9D3VLG1_9ROSI|nr:hypothetical protein J1N35_024223 [Gossypium stocksii]